MKKVDDYITQAARYETDNNLNYEKEFNIISNYFNFNLIDENNI